MTILRRTLAAVCALLPLVVLTPIDSTAQQEEAAEDTAVERVEPRGGDLPLETERTVSFSTSEGSWISVDVSPDGGTLVFDLLGDIYTMPITGGSPTLLAGGLAFEAQPRFSPDGESIVYISDRSGGQNVWIMSLDGSDTTQVTTGKDNLYTSPEWTPDGEYIVVSRTYSPLGGEAKLRLYHVEGGSGAALIDGPESLKTLGAAFGPDPRYIWFAQRSGDWEYNTTLPDYQVAVYDRETGSRTSMTSRYGSGFRPALSPDGRWLAYGSRHEDETGLRLRDLDSGEERWLAYPVQHDDQESRATLDALPGYSFTPDSREIVISYGGGIWRVPIDGSEPEEIPFAVDIALDIGPELDFEYRVDDAATFDVRQIRDAVPSPDGSRLAFTALDRLYVMDWPDGAPRRLTGLDTGEYQPTWSPDGSSIAFVTWSDAEGGHIYRANAGGGQARPLTETAAYYGQPAWSPDGERIVAVRAAARSRREGGGRMGAELVWVPANGGEVSTIAPAAGRGSPHFTTDPDRIYTYSGSDGLVSMRWDGTDERTHLRVTGATPAGGSRPRPASTILMAPRGDRALAEVENELYVVTVPYVGGETPSLSVTRPENAAFPMRRLTDIGGDFPAWGSDGRTVHWSIGNAHLVYDLDRAEAVEDSIAAVERAMLGDPEDQQPDTAAAENGAQGDEDDAYEPAERRIRVEAPRDVPSGVVVLRGARAITMNGDEIIEDADILVRDNRIAAIGARGSVEIPADADTIDLEGQTVVPGFIDTHAHLRPDRDIHTDQPWQYLANLAYGVTTTRDPQTGTTDVLSYSDRVRTGDIVGPRVYSTGPGIFGSYQGTGIRDLDHARSILRRYSDYYDTKTFKMYLAGNREQRQWLIMAARELGLMPTTEAGLDFALDLTHAIDGYPGIEHNLPIYPLYDDVVQLFAQSGVTNTPTLIVSFGGPMGENWFFSTEDVHDEPRLNRFTPHTVLDALTRRRGSNWFMRDEYVFDDHARFLADLVEAGGRVGVGGHGQLQGLGWHWELWMVQSGGMSEHDALRAATLHGAAAIGLERDLGSLEAGKLADLVVLDGDPLTDIRNSDTVALVMKNGRLYEADSLSEIWPREGEAPGFWSEEEPVTAAGVR